MGHDRVIFLWKTNQQMLVKNLRGNATDGDGGVIEWGRVDEKITFQINKRWINACGLKLKQKNLKNQGFLLKMHLLFSKTTTLSTQSRCENMVCLTCSQAPSQHTIIFWFQTGGAFMGRGWEEISREMKRYGEESDSSEKCYLEHFE